MYDLAVKNGLIFSKGVYHKASIYIRGGKFSKITENDFKAERTIDASGKKVFPGIIDPHVHFALNTGKFTSADDFKSGSEAAARGGVTTVIDFLDPVSEGGSLEKAFAERMKLASRSIIDYSFHATAANPVGETESITREAVRLKIPSIKIFTAYSESGRRTYDKEIAELLELSSSSGTVILAHAEDEDFIVRNSEFIPADLPVSRPEISEISMIGKLAALNEKYGGKIYVVHTTCGDSIIMLKNKYSRMLNRSLFIESCPHYFRFDESCFSRTDGALYVLAPPLRSAVQKKRLGSNIDGVYSIGTDHCPFMSAEKDRAFLKDIPYGIGGIEFSFPLMYSLFGESIIEKMTHNPAVLFGLYPAKGTLSEGSDADFFIYDESSEQIISGNHSACDYNLYDSVPVSGRVETTVSGGNVIFENGITAGRTGNFIAREVLNESRH